ncbi:TRAF-type zinc finger domain-containing protein 1 [Sorex araneus]|uniref:TRAF-type zinc finger domain-containing protein 1 n=1 Tax=Sorex araneus TaxID=42254 RepID=UPI002433D6D2|nr:TRAF-type zinc finger domain-containing protein 1 [Sorex araneus]
MAEFLDDPDTRLCDNCKREIPVFNFTIHEIHCQRNIGVCPVCKEPCPKSEMEAHMAADHCQVTCKCSRKLEKRQLKQHEEAECPLRPARCQHCELELAVVRLQEHEEYCGARTELCGACGRNVLVKDLKAHPAVCGQAGEAKRAEAPPSPDTYDAPWAQDGIWIASQLLRQIEALDPPTRLSRRPLRDFESDLFHGGTPERRDVGSQFPGHSGRLEEQERQERNGSRQPPGVGGEDSSNLDYMLALSLQSEGQLPSVAEQGFWRAVCEVGQSRAGPSAPGSDAGADVETMLPCEFCEELYPEELLIDHQTSCNPSCSLPPLTVGSPSPRGVEDPDVIFQKLLQEAASNQLDSLMGLKSPGPAEDSVIIPCEFCGVQLEEEVLFHHQDQCDQRPVTANHHVMEAIPRQESRPPATSPELPKRRLRHQGDLSFGYVDNTKQAKGPAHPLAPGSPLGSLVPPCGQLAAAAPSSRPACQLSPPRVLKLSNLAGQDPRGRSRSSLSGAPAPGHSPALHSARTLYPENLAPSFPRGPAGRFGASGRSARVAAAPASYRRAAKAKPPKQPGAGGAGEEE